ncbi:rifin PIR protein, putative [Plasmodium reichenowi]|uniref:Rifin PIR protein, putative n=1 Tax=Plasmodium reichenowi TaxID=5854 RepID=A0A2P9DE77_PLARE|nr:rifin PIR protein, putative [Plasmodium reichenowi]
MNVHYINILLFAFLLNILEHNKRNHKSPTPSHTPTTRLLCECELYAPANYDSDPQMKKIMQQFEDRTSQSFEEYDDRMKTTRKKCKEQCDKEIQKIILKDKLEKQMAEQLTTLETKINTNDIPTCVCEKSLADKTEKFCLNCGMNVGGGVTLSSGVLGEIGGLAVNAWKDAAIIAAKEAAEKAGAAQGAIEGLKAGNNAIIGALQQHFHIDNLNSTTLQSFFTTTRYNDVTTIATAIDTKMSAACSTSSTGNDAFCGLRVTLNIVANPGQEMVPQKTAITKGVTQFVEKATQAADYVTKTTTDKVTAQLTAQKTALIEGGFDSSITSINAAIIAIVVIILILVIIYLILRYRRKKKMKKKLQYIKLLEE